MSARTTEPGTASSSRVRRRRRWIWVVALAAVGSLTVALGVLLLGLSPMRTPTPQFPSLAAAPDPTLQGTVAYFADQTACVRIVAAAGRPSKDVLCLAPQDPAKAQRYGKLVGPQLVWRPDGRLEVTMFRLTTPAGPSFNPGWQKLVDVRTGAVQDVPAAEVPSQPDWSHQPMVSPDGRRIILTSDRGRVTVVLHQASGSRTLLSVRGPADYTYGMSSAFWAPNWQWVAADDGRILIITTGEPAVTRVLTAESVGGGYGGYPRFAVTDANLLTPAN